MARYPKIAKQLHLPFQSGSSRVLKAMNRHYDRETYLQKVNYAKKVMPDLVLTSPTLLLASPERPMKNLKRPSA